MKGFFNQTELPTLRQSARIPKCGACGLFKKCKTPKMAISGQGRKGILIIGEYPGETEDDQGVQFVGKAGRRLRQGLERVGIDADKDCWLTDAAICHPHKNQLPEQAIDYCRPNVLRAIEELKPKVIILLGGSAVRSVIGHLWKEDCGGIGRWTGWQIPCQRWNCFICPNYHPKDVIREENPVLDKFFDHYLRTATRIKEKPFADKIPNYLLLVDVEMNTDEAAKKIQILTSGGKPLAFDYETDRLAPDSEDAWIACCSVSDGYRAIAFPWQGKCIKVMRELLCNMPFRWIASNLKFEERWTRATFSKGVRFWYWDTMLAAHLLDNRSRVAGLKFQAFALLGQESYDDKIKPYLRSKEGGNTPNRVREAPLHDLLLYCGMDSLLEAKIAEVQRKQLKMEE